MTRLISLLFMSILLGQCAVPTSLKDTQKAYIQSIEAWRKEQVTELTATNSWLALAGLYPLREGDNSFGADAKNDLVFPAKTADRLGIFTLSGNSVRMQLEAGVNAQIGAAQAEEELLIFKDSKAELIHYGTFSWTVIERGGRYFLRLWDAENPSIQTFKGLSYFPIQERWRVPATFVEKQRTLSIHNVLDMDFDQVSTGILTFQLKGKTYELTTLDGGPKSFFVIFSDETTGTETYGSGRYLYVDKPDENGKTWIDFNKAYNPPCAFTAFATCPLPPKENHLEVAVVAGELNYGGH